ncbi:hypothetical protein R3P38DRAFT_2891626 [Favolaschia claudopus]|uniref:Uncharacterized protein n=1 Tax=Favolaschia claudopus TaxID=2862362 RepID=A0AAW0CVN4_9AGAR
MVYSTPPSLARLVLTRYSLLTLIPISHFSLLYKASCASMHSIYLPPVFLVIHCSLTHILLSSTKPG